jgi:hypothetical protein
MNGEISIGGVYMPTLLGVMVFAYLLLAGLRLVLLKAGVYRHVWHPPLFNLALYVLVLGALVALFRKVF